MGDVNADLLRSNISMKFNREELEKVYSKNVLDELEQVTSMILMQRHTVNFITGGVVQPTDDLVYPEAIYTNLPKNAFEQELYAATLKYTKPLSAEDWDYYGCSLFVYNAAKALDMLRGGGIPLWVPHVARL